MSALKPMLVIDSTTNKVCMQLRYGEYTATLELPEHLAHATPELLEAFFAKVVPDMTQNLYNMRRNDSRKLRKRAACATGSTELSQDSQDET